MKKVSKFIFCNDFLTMLIFYIAIPKLLIKLEYSHLSVKLVAVAFTVAIVAWYLAVKFDVYKEHNIKSKLFLLDNICMILGLSLLCVLCFMHIDMTTSITDMLILVVLSYGLSSYRMMKMKTM